MYPIFPPLIVFQVIYSICWLNPINLNCCSLPKKQPGSEKHHLSYTHPKPKPCITPISPIYQAYCWFLCHFTDEIPNSHGHFNA